MTITEKNTNANEMEIVPKENEQIISASDIEVVSKVEGYINTLDLDSEDGRMMTVRAYNGAESLAQSGVTLIKATDCITVPGVRKSRIAGQPATPCTNVYLIDVDGRVFFTQSDGIADSVAMIAALFPDFGKNTKRGYLELEVLEQQTVNGNTMKRLNPVM